MSDPAGAADRGGRANGRRRRGDPNAVVPPSEPRTYYDQPVLKEPVWTVEIPWYLFAGGLAGGSSILAVTARAVGATPVQRAAQGAAAVAAAASPVLLIADLGRPARFLNMLRVVKVTSPMSVGSWLLAAYAPSAIGAQALSMVRRAPRLRDAALFGAAGLGSMLATYTAVLLSDTAVPVWHDARRELPFAFAGGAALSAGGVAVALVSPRDAAVARWALAAGAVQREIASVAMERRLGALGEPLRAGRAGRYQRLSRWTSAAGAGLALTVGRRQRSAAVASGVLATAGAVFERLAVFRAGFASAADPAATTGPQRRRVDAGEQA